MSISVSEVLLQIVKRSVEESGGSVALISRINEPHPLILTIQTGTQVQTVWVYIWTLTHGGGTRRPADEYRIQLTSVASPLRTNPDGPTLLLGYEAKRNCFAGFDVRKHLTFSGRSPSVQIRIPVLDEAVRTGIAFGKKGNDEIAIGFRPDFFLVYALNCELLHDQAIDSATVALMTKVVNQQPIEQEELDTLIAPRRRVVTAVARLTRAAGFRGRVMQAYDSTCAVTGIQLGLVDAAHILPVGAESSTDDTSNGVCLSATFHRAFDSALIFLDERYYMRFNVAKADELESRSLAAGKELLIAHLNKQIALPKEQRHWPDVALILKANEFRQIHAW